MHSRISFLTIMAIVGLVLLTSCLSGLSMAAEPQVGALGVEPQFDKVSYRLSDNITGRILLVNSLIEPLNTNIEFLVYPRTENPANVDMGLAPIDRQRWRNIKINPGGQEVSFTKDVASIFEVSGVYPVRVIVTGLGTPDILADVTSFVIILDEEEMKKLPLKCCFILPMSYEPSRGPQGAFLDSNLYDLLQPEKPDGLVQLTEALSQEQTAHFSLTLSSALAQELSYCPDGFDYFEGRVKKSLDSNSPEAAGAALTLDRLRSIGANANVDILSGLYSSVPVPTLMAKGWSRDVGEQWDRTIKSLKDAKITQDPTGFVDSNMELTEGTVRFMAARGVKTMVAVKSNFAAETETGAVRLDSYDNPVDILISNEELSKQIASSPTERSLQVLWAYLAVEFLRDSSSDTPGPVVIAPRSWSPTNAFIKRLFTRMTMTPWMTTMTASEAAAASKSESPKFKIRPKQARVEALDKDYMDKLEKARNLYLTIDEAIEGDNELKARMQVDLFSAQSLSRMQKDSRAAFRYTFINSLKSRFEEPMKKLDLVAEPILTLSGMSGRLPFAVTNKNGFDIRGSLVFKGGNFSFPDGNTVRATFKPKENVYALSLKARESGQSPVNISLMVGQEEIDELTVNVKTSNLNLTAAMVIGLVLLVILAYFARRRHRGGGR